MRPSLLSRSVIAVASIAVGSAAFAAMPAQAATSNGITGEQVRAAATAYRAPFSSQPQYEAAQRLVRSLAIRACTLDTDGGEYVAYVNAAAAQPAGGVDGVIVSTYIRDADSSVNRFCNFAALATSSASTTLSGTATLTGTSPYSSGAPATKVFGSSALTGDVFVTPAVDVPDYGRIQVDATGSATTVTRSTVVTKVKDVKTKAEKKKAKATYANRLKAAKKSFSKKLAKADSKSEKVAAKRAYRLKRASAKAKYKTAIANYRLVKQTRSTSSAAPFTVTASTYNAND